MHLRHIRPSVAILSALVLAAIPLHAGTTILAPQQAPSTTGGSSPWFWRFALYGWAQSLDGDIGVLGRSASVSADFSDVVQDLNIAVMGLVEVGRGRWSVLLDFNYVEVGDNGTARRNQVRLRPATIPRQPLGGVRSCPNRCREVRCPRRRTRELDRCRPRHRQVQRFASESWVDPVIGVRFRAQLSPHWYFRAAGDIGGFGAASDLTWQAMAGFGWQFNDTAAPSSATARSAPIIPTAASPTMWSPTDRCWGWVQF